MRHSRRRRGVIAIATSALALGSIALATGSASADIGGCTVSTNAGTVGVLQQINLFSCSEASNVQITYSNGSAQQNLTFIPGGAGGTSTVNWTPTSTGGVSITVPGTSATASTNISITSTFTTISAPNTAQVGVATKITVTVQSNSPSSYTPTGTVTVRNGQGNVIQTMGLTPTAPNSGQSYAYWWFTAPSSGNYFFQASYGGNASATSSTSPQDVMFASSSGNTITLVAPGTLTVGVPVTLTATFVPTTIQGSVGFTYNGQPISASVPIQNGVATFNWIPPAAGSGNLGANYMTNGGASGSSTPDPVVIVAGPAQTDAITLTQPGFGTWAPNGTYTLPSGASTTMTASTLSGSPVTLTETGPCTISGLTITVPPGGGQCNIQARSNGGNGYAPVTYGYTVNAGLAQQTATIAAPLSGNINKGRTIVLDAPGQGDTNAGQAINWMITQGKRKVCKLIFPRNGSVKLKMTGKGQCTVQGTAAGIPNQWTPYRVVRTYTA